MTVRTVQDCFAARILRRISPDPEKSKQSLLIAEKRLSKAHEALTKEFYDFALLEAYTAMFHASRALLYQEGIQEKSHYAVYLYLKEHQQFPEDIANLLNIHRAERHDVLYGLEYEVTQEDAKTTIKDAISFMNIIKEILKNLQRLKQS